MKLLDDFNRLNKIKTEQGLRIKTHSSPSVYIAQSQLIRKLTEIIDELGLNYLTIKYRLNYTATQKLVNKVFKIKDIDLLNEVYDNLINEEGLIKALNKLKGYKGYGK